MASLSRSSSLISCPAGNTDEIHSWNSKENTYSFLLGRGAFEKPNEASERKGLFSDRILDLLKVDRIEPGRIICSFIVNPHVTNPYGTLHGGAVAVVAKLVAEACARTVGDEDKELYLGELNMSYHSASAVNVELEVDGSIVKSGRNVTTTSVEFRVKGTKKVAYTARATFFTTPNPYSTLHGGVVATVASLVAMACARTVVNEDKELLLGELNISYLSASGINVELEIDGRITRSGRNVTTASVEFRVKGTKKLVYTANAIFFTAPVPKL